jgi:hypothetical protein
MPMGTGMRGRHRGIGIAAPMRAAGEKADPVSGGKRKVPMLPVFVKLGRAGREFRRSACNNSGHKRR